MSEKALTVHEPMPVARPIEMHDLFARAIDKGPDGVATLRELLQVRREMEAEAAKKAYDAAMAAFQAECPPVSKPKGVKTRAGEHAYSYAPLEHVIQTVKPFIQKHGFSYTLDTDTESKDGWVIAKCKVTHSAGHSETSTAKFPLGAGTQLMSTTQVYAAALTFASRRVFQNAFGIVCAGEDTIEEGNRQKPAGPSKLRADDANADALRCELWDVLKSVRGTAKNWDEANVWLSGNDIINGDEQAPRFTPERFKQVIAKAKEKLNVR